MSNKKVEFTEDGIEFVLYFAGLSFKRGYLDGYNLAVSLKAETRAEDGDFDDVLDSAIKKTNKSFRKKLEKFKI